jgi:hypothetical protein
MMGTYERVINAGVADCKGVGHLVSVKDEVKPKETIAKAT